MTSSPRPRMVLAVDLGQSIDPTAIALLQVVTRLDGQIARAVIPHDVDMAVLDDARAPGRFASIDVLELERLPLGLDYVTQAEHVARRMRDANLVRLQPELVIDRTGVGRPVFDLFRRTGLDPVGVTITAGEDVDTKVDGEDRTYRVSKMRLVSQLQAALNAGELRVAAELTERPNLVSELENFRATISETGFARFGAREGQHDDLVLAVAIGAWWAGRKLPAVGMSSWEM